EDPDERAAAKARQELLTPIAKAWSTDVGVEVASMGVQVHGGMGFIEETGAAQHYRDARIAPIYEGTNGIQAIDLVGRKVGMENGGVMKALCAELALTAEQLTEVPDLASVGRRLAAGVGALERATDWLLAHRGQDSLAAATPYLKLAGDVVGGAMLGRQALAALADPSVSGDPWLQGKAALARVFAGQVLTQAPGIADGLTDGAADLEATPFAALTA
ncbi:MAG: acyl-CoA dehydrogenase, partial [Proteobacteria bacterium]|nr:acyl-CoA dehydrogenase [Pseudomonadota bacterium]